MSATNATNDDLVKYIGKILSLVEWDLKMLNTVERVNYLMLDLQMVSTKSLYIFLDNINLFIETNRYTYK